MKIFKSKIFWGIAVAVVALAIWGFSRGGSKGEYIQASIKDVVQEVKATGSLTASSDVALGFDRSGKVAHVYKKVGDSVYAGETIADLANSSLSLNDAKAALLNQIRDSYTETDNALHNKADQFFKNLSSKNAKFEVSITENNFTHYFDIPNEIVIEVVAKRLKVSGELSTWGTDLATITSGHALAQVDRYLSYMNDASNLLDQMSSSINSFVSGEFQYNTTVEGYKDDISSARSEVLSASSALLSAREKVNNATDSFDKSTIVSPISGTVTVQDAKVGEAVGASTPLVSIISRDNYIEANISEVNIGKVSVGNPVKIEFDAFPSEVFEGKIYFIEPGERTIDGVVNYKVRISLLPNESTSKLKVGLTGSLSIETNKKAGVVTIPAYAVMQDGDKMFVMKPGANGESVRVEVTTGLLGTDGFIEVTSGLQDGDNVELPSAK